MFERMRNTARKMQAGEMQEGQLELPAVKPIFPLKYRRLKTN